MDVPVVRFPRAEHRAFYFEDTHLMSIIFPRDGRRLMFLVTVEDGDIQLDFPGDTFEETVRDKVERVFFVELQEENEDVRSLVLAAYFPVDEVWYGAYYGRHEPEDGHTMYFLRVIGEGETASLEPVQEEQEHRIVVQEFMARYEGLLGMNHIP